MAERETGLVEKVLKNIPKGVKSAESSCKQLPSIATRVGTIVSNVLESSYYKLGYAIATRPWTVIFCTFILSSVFALGFINFEMKDSSEPIWIPPTSVLLKNQKWVEKNFPLKRRYNTYIVTAENVLDPAVIKQMYKLDIQVKSLEEINNTEHEILNFNWSSICIRLSGNCWSNSILQLWGFNGTLIKNLRNVNDVIERIKGTRQFKVSDWLGGVTYGGDGQIVKAKAAKMLYVIKSTSTDEKNTKIIAPDLLWETRFIELAVTLDKEKPSPISGVSVNAIRSFRDEAYNSFGGDVLLLLAGICIIVSYVTVILGKFNEVEQEVYLALGGVLGIALASIISYGFSSAIGMFYGPIHPILPFLLLGLGVDDMFVIVEAWENLKECDKNKDVKVKVAITMKHAGVSITVTSITDFVTFAIGASTKLPVLRSFCVYAAAGILTLYIIQSTFFVALLTLDQRRQTALRDGCCVWIKYNEFVPNRCSQKLFLPWFLRKFFSPILLTLPAKMLVSLVFLIVMVVSGYGAYMLDAGSDLSWFLSPDSYVVKFLNAQEKYFVKGLPANLYLGQINYFRDNKKLLSMTSELRNSRFIGENNLINWHSDFNNWLVSEASNQTAKNLNIRLNNQSYPTNEMDYYRLLNVYIGSSGKRHYDSLKWNDTNPATYRQLQASKIGLLVKNVPFTAEEIAALEFFERLSEKYFPEDSFIWAVGFRNWETNRIIQKELYINMSLAFAAVSCVTLLLVVNFIICLLITSCVVITLINVCGFMYFWGLTIDTLTSILLILSIGLAVDYSAHIGHKFMTIKGSKNERAQYTVFIMGPAVINGGFSTFLAFVLLATSNSYIFLTFFKVFFLVIIFGLFNGICVLPILLSWYGPEPYLNATRITLNSRMTMFVQETEIEMKTSGKLKNGNSSDTHNGKSPPELIKTQATNFDV